MKSHTFWKKIGTIAFVINLIIISCVIVRDIIKQPEQKGILESLQKEFYKIDKLPTASVVGEKYTCFTGKTSIDITYSTTTQDDEIQKFYDAELLKNGWKLIDQNKIYDWGRDLGGKTITYSKSNILLGIQFSGDRGGYGWAYSIFVKMKD